MRTSIAAIAFLCLFLSSTVFGQSAILKGKVVDDKEKPVSSARIITPDGQADVTDSKGQFTIAFPKTVQPGQATRLELRDKPNWVIYEPLMGNCVIQNKERNFEPLAVVIVPKGSPLALSPKRLSQVIARWANERVQLRSQVKEQQSQLDEYAFLREYAEKYGFTLEQFRNAADQWAHSKIAADKLEAGWQEYWKKNYDRAAQFGYESRLAFQEKLKRDKEQRLEDGRQFIRSAWLEGNARYAENKFRESAAAYQAIETAFHVRELVREDFPEEWAATKNSVGNAKWQLGMRVEGQESKLLLAEAVSAFREALKVYTREQFPQDWAGTQTNLGNALWSQGERSSGEESVGMLAEAINAYREALQVRTREQFPQDGAATQNNLGAALKSLSERSNGGVRARLLAEAVATYGEVLKVRTRKQSPQDWAITQNNLGVALMSLGEWSSGEESIQLLSKAIIAYREALQVRTREQLPQDWAATQNNLGDVFHLQGERTSGAESVRLLTEAVNAYREALKVYTRELLPQNWALTQNNLGVALMSMGRRSSGEEGRRLLIEAASAYRDALNIYTREQLPQAWALTQNNFGIALMTMGERTSGEDSEWLLAEAVSAYREALKVRNREQLPQDWAATQNNLGIALRSQGERSSSKEGVRLLTEAVSAFREALKVYTREQFPQAWALTQNNLGIALKSLGERKSNEDGEPLLAASIVAYYEALKVRTREQLPQDWAATQNNLGNALSIQGERSNGEASVQLLAEAITAYREALKVRTREQLPQDWAITQRNIAKTYHLLRDWNNAAIGYVNTLTLYPDYEEGYQRLSTIYHERVFEYAKAHALHDQWLRRFPEDAAAQADFAATHFTTGRFAEFPSRLKPLLANPELPATTKIALQMIEVANLLALDQAAQVPAALAGLRETIAAQPANFHITWSFAGTLHFINQEEKLAAYRAWLNQFFGAAQAENRDAILKVLREAQAQFPSAK